MPKAVWQNFNNGLMSESDRNLPDGAFYGGLGVDFYRKKGYIMPGNAFNGITFSGFSASPVFDISYDEVNGNAYLLWQAKISRLNNVNTTPVIDSNIDGASNNYYTVANMTNGKGIVYNAGGTIYFFWTWTNGATAYLGRSQLTGTFAGGVGDSKTYKTRSVDGATGEVDIIEWGGNLIMTSGEYLDQFVGSSATLNTGWFDFGAGYASKCLTRTQSYLVSFVTKALTTALGPDSKAVFIDGSSTTVSVKDVPLKGVKYVYSCRNLNGEIHFWADLGRGYASHCLLIDDGYSVIDDSSHDISGTLQQLGFPNYSQIDIFDNRLIWGIGKGSFGKYGLVFSYGKQPVGSNEIISMPFQNSVVSGSLITALKYCTNNTFIMGLFDGASTYSIAYVQFKKSDFGTATFKGGYLDLPQKGIVNYMKIYGQPTVSGDSLTATLDTDYGTSNTPQTNAGVMSFAIDGAVTKKKFDFGGIECHAFRPVINWTAQGTPISKIVVDYDLLDD